MEGHGGGFRSQHHFVVVKSEGALSAFASSSSPLELDPVQEWKSTILNKSKIVEEEIEAHLCVSPGKLVDSKLSPKSVLFCIRSLNDSRTSTSRLSWIPHLLIDAVGESSCHSLRQSRLGT